MKRISKKRDFWTAFFFIAPGVIFVFFLCLYPLGRAIWMSMVKTTPDGVNQFIGLTNYKKVFDDKLFRLSLWHTLYFTGISVSLHYFVGLGLALLLDKLGKSLKGNVLRGFLFLPWLFPSAVWCVTWQLILHPHFSVLNELLRAIGLSNLTRGWLTEPTLLPLTSLSVVNGWKFFPFHMVMLFATLQSVPKELYEVAEIDGASGWKKFQSVTWPFLKPITAIVLTIDTIGTFHYFDLVWILTQGGPMNKTEVLSTYIYRTVFRMGSFEYGSTLAVLLMIILSILIVLYIRIFMRGEFEQ